MFKAIKDNKIIAINETGDFPCLVYDEVIEDTEHNSKDYVQVDGEYVLTTDDKAVELKKEQMREIRNKYLSDFVDPYQLVIRWGTLTEQEQTDLVNYRQYLLNYTAGESWWEQNPMGFEEWKASQAVLEEME